MSVADLEGARIAPLGSGNNFCNFPTRKATKV